MALSTGLTKRAFTSVTVYPCFIRLFLTLSAGTTMLPSALLALGSMVVTADKVRKSLMKQGYTVTLVNARFVKPVDKAMLDYVCYNHRLIVTLEENVSSGGFGRTVCQYISDSEYENHVLSISLPDDYIEHGSVDILRRETGIDEDTIIKRITAVYNNIGDNNNEQ